jgi:MATE family multidrug resistance protein
VFDALQVVGAMSLRGLKDARAPMILAGASYWLAGAPMCFLLAVGLHMGGFGVWLGLAFGLFVAASSMSLRFWRLSRR